MGFTTIKFLLALAVAGAAYQVCPARFRTNFLLLTSYGYYWLAQPRNAALLLVSTLATFLVARHTATLENDRTRPLLVWGTVGALIATLFFYKFRQSAHSTLLIPLGLSYYTFKLVSYLIDVHWKTISASANFSQFALYSAFFPQIVAGPIQRAESFLPQIASAKAPGGSQLVGGTHRILLGLFKKFVIADQLGPLVAGIYENASRASGADVLLAFYLFPIQIYADFSGITDIAIGAAAVFGIVSPENFRAPFLASSLSEYWRRWHMTLTEWIGDYVFAPLRMAIRNWGNAGLVVSLFTTMIAIGLWHGVQWTYVLFGVFHAFWMSIDALTQRARRSFFKRRPHIAAAATFLGVIFTYHLVATGLVFWRAPDVATIPALLSGMFTHGASTILSDGRRSVVVALVAFVLIEALELWRQSRPLPLSFQVWPRWARWSLYSCTALSFVLALILIFALNVKKNPFLYAAF